MSSIPISPVHGVNPAIPKCFYCQKDKNMIILAGRLPGDAQAPQRCIWDMEPCDQCKGYMDQGIVIIEVRDGEYDKIEREQCEHNNEQNRLRAKERRPFIPNPYRSGGWWVVRDAMIERLLLPESADLCKQILGCRWMFLEQHVAKAIGLRDDNQEKGDP